jgi:hypothetical protein
MLSVKEAVSLSAAHVSMGWTTKEGTKRSDCAKARRTIYRRHEDWTMHV